MKFALIAALVTLASANTQNVTGLEVYGGEWCMGKPIGASRHGIKPRAGAEFRGEYRDMTLWVESDPSKVQDCKVIADHRQKKSNQLWVVEFNSKPLMEKEIKRAKKAGIEVLAIRNMSVILSNSKQTVPDAMGYDACGEEEDFSVISVSTTPVRGPRAMSAVDKARYMAMARTKNQKNVNLLDRVSQEQLLGYITHFQSYQSRNSYAGQNGLDQAADWVAERFADFGFDVSRHAYNDEITPQVVAELKGRSDRIVVMGAHFDSRATERASPTQRAPGADDNGSGSAALLEFARVIQQAGAEFEHTIRLVLFTGEEQGLLGSRAIARQWADEDKDIIAMFNADMIGYRQPDKAFSTLGFMNRYADLDLTEISKVTSTTYVPSLNVGFTQACCSDQQSFYENGFPSVGWFETATETVVYPQYHKENDLLQFLDAEQIYLQGTSAMASVTLFAELL